MLFFAWSAVAWGQKSYEVQWAPELALTDLARISQRLDKPFDSPLTLKRSGQTVKCANCASLLQRRRTGYATVPESDAQAVQSLAVDCLAIEAVGRARPARTSFLRALRFGPETLSLLPPGLAPSISNEDRDKAQSATAKGLSWKQFDPAATASPDGSGLVVVSDDIRTLIKIYGRGDFTGDGIDDLLLRVDTAALHGSYRSSRLFLLTRSSPSATLRIARELK
jgi:hypothetical protein